jgi:hypothetical protein
LAEGAIFVIMIGKGITSLNWRQMKGRLLGLNRRQTFLWEIQTNEDWFDGRR